MLSELIILWIMGIIGFGMISRVVNDKPLSGDAVVAIVLWPLVVPVGLAMLVAAMVISALCAFWQWFAGKGE